MINFNVPPFTGKEYEYIKEAVDAQKICGDGQFTKKCNQWIEEKTGTKKALHVTLVSVNGLKKNEYLYVVQNVISGDALFKG